MNAKITIMLFIFMMHFKVDAGIKSFNTIVTVEKTKTIKTKTPNEKKPKTKKSRKNKHNTKLGD